MEGIELHDHEAVRERVAEFYRDHPEGSVRTFAVRLEGPEAVFEARVYRTPEEAAMGIYTSGWAREVEGKSPAGRGNHLENSESGAIGRALANLGYGGGAAKGAARGREEHDALLEYIKATGPRVGDDAEILVGGQIRNLRRFVRENWSAMKEQPRLARTVVEAVERATGTAFRREAA